VDGFFHRIFGIPFYIIFALKFFVFYYYFVGLEPHAAIPLGSAFNFSMAYLFTTCLFSVFFLTVLFIFDSSVSLNNSSSQLGLFVFLYPKTVQKAFFTPKLNVICFYVICFLMFYSPWLNSVNCATFDATNSPTQQLIDLVNSFSDLQLHEFNSQFDTFRSRVLLAIAINVTLCCVVFYGPTILQGTIDLVSRIPSALQDFGHALVVDFPAYLTENARQAALRNIRNADPETVQRLLETAQRIASGHSHVPPSA
jgi:hypothetical protein